MTSQTTIPFGIYWKLGIWGLATSAYVGGGHRPGVPAPSSAGSPKALELHARRSPQQRADLAAAAEQHPAQVSTRKSFNKKHGLPASTIGAGEDAIVADRAELGRVVTRSAFAQEAVIAANDEARRRLGRDLLPPPQSSATDRRDACRCARAEPARQIWRKAPRCIGGRSYSRAHALIRHPRAG